MGLDDVGFLFIFERQVRRWLRKEYADEKVKKLIGKISNGF